MTGNDCANKAMDLVDGVIIPYIHGGETIDGLDCQGLIEYVVRDLGGKISYAGSNDMYRNACTEVKPLGQIPLEPGMVLFIVEHDGGEPDQYKADGLGNASHVGWYTGGRHEVVHASSSKGYVVPSTIKNGWTHAGKLKGVQYNDEKSSTGYINLPVDETVFLRIKPSKLSPWFARIPGQSAVEIVSIGKDWTRARWGGHDGYIVSRFVVASSTPVEPDNAEEIAFLISLRDQINMRINALNQV